MPSWNTFFNELIQEVVPEKIVLQFFSLFYQKTIFLVGRWPYFVTDWLDLWACIFAERAETGLIL